MVKGKVMVCCMLVSLLVSGCALNVSRNQSLDQSQKQSPKQSSKQSVSVETKLKNVVESYNQTLIRVMSTGNSELLNAVATDKEVRRISLFLSALNAEKKMMTAKLVKFQIKTVEPKTSRKPSGSSLVDADGNPVGSSAVDTQEYGLVQTDELWEHQNYSQITGEKIDEPFRIHYIATYWLQEIDGKWLVSKLHFEEKPVE